jgi:uncharacterized protein
VPILPQFPLGSVLLPGMILPLHVFEPRYRALTRDVLDGDREFGVPLIQRGSEVGGGDQRSDIGTVARVVEAEELPDGRWGVVAVGLRRYRVVRWLPDDPYPVAEVEDWPDEPSAPEPEEYRAVVATLRRVLAMAAELGEAVPPSTVDLSDDPSEGSFQIAVLAPLGPHDKQALLRAPSAEARLARARTDLEAVAELLAFRLQPGDDDDEA